MSRESLGWGGFSLSIYRGEDNGAHGGKKNRSAYLTSQPKFDALEPSRLQALALVCTQEAAFPIVCGPLPLLNTIY